MGPMHRLTNGRALAGWLLIALGVGLFAVQFFEEPGTSTVLLVLGALFVVGYLFTRQYALAVPGGILLGLGAGMLGAPRFPAFANFTAFALGLGFLLIWLLTLLHERRNPWWPLIPASILVAIGVPKSHPLAEFLARRGWPLLLVLIGVFVLFRGPRGARRGGIERGRG